MENYWNSSQYCRWTYPTKRDFSEEDEFTDEERENVHRMMKSFIEEIASYTIGSHRRLHSSIVYSAVTYYRRFFLKHSFYDFDPRLVAATCVYIAAKVLEDQMRLDTVPHAITRFAPAYFGSTTSALTNIKDEHILQCEFYVIDALEYDLALFHPFRDLLLYVLNETRWWFIFFLLSFLYGSLCTIGRLKGDEINDDVLVLAWSICGETYSNHIIFDWPPFMIACGSLYLSLVYYGYDADYIFQRFNVNEIQLNYVQQDLIRVLEKLQLNDDVVYDKKLLKKLEQCVPIIEPTNDSTEHKKGKTEDRKHKT